MRNLILPLVLFLGTLAPGAAQAAQQIVSAANGSCLANPDGSLEPATRLVVTPCTGTSDQLWEFFADGRIVNATSGLCMGVPWSKMDQRAGVYQVECDGKKHRLWQVDFVGDATIVIRSEAGGLCLDVENRAKTESSNAVQDPCSDIPSQMWMTTGAASAVSAPIPAPIPSQAPTPAPAAAFDPSVPVREVMRLDAKGDTLAYFSEERLATLYSQDLVGFYNRAARTPLAQQMGGRVFDYDFIIGGQDHCPLQNISFQSEQAFQTSWDVTVQFQSEACWGNQETTKVVFLVVEENGRPVIDDIFAYHDGETDVLKVTLDQFLPQQQ